MSRTYCDQGSGKARARSDRAKSEDFPDGAWEMSDGVGRIFTILDLADSACTIVASLNSFDGVEPIPPFNLLDSVEQIFSAGWERYNRRNLCRFCRLKPRPNRAVKSSARRASSPSPYSARFSPPCSNSTMRRPISQ